MDTASPHIILLKVAAFFNSEEKNRLLMANTLTSNSTADNKVNKWVTSGDIESSQGQAILRSEPLTERKAF